MTWLYLYFGIGFFLACIQIPRLLSKQVDLNGLLKFRFRKEIEQGEIQSATHGDRLILHSNDVTQRRVIDTTRKSAKLFATYPKLCVVIVGGMVYIFGWPFLLKRYLVQ